MKNKLAISLMSIAAAASLLAGCGKKDEEEVTLKSFELTGIPTVYKSTDTIAWNDLVVVAKYSNNTTQSFTSEVMEFDVETPAEADTKVVLDTQGLHGMTGALTEKRYEISAKLTSDMSKTYSAGSIVVGDVVREKYVLNSYDLPAWAVQYNNARANAKDDDTLGTFKKGTELFTVGTMNPFVFEPEASFSPIDDQSTSDNFTNYEKKIELFDVTGTQKVAALADYQILQNGSIRFNNSAIGKTFKLVMSPKDFTVDAFDDEVVPVDFTFKVEKGFNVYNALQLGILNLTHLTTADFKTDQYSYCCFHGDDDHTNGQSKVFLTNEGYKSIDLPRVWRSFLINKGAFAESEIDNFNDVPGIFLMNNIEIKKGDIPQEYFINANDPAGGNTGRLRDDSGIYIHAMTNELTINGNYMNLNVYNNAQDAANSIDVCGNVRNSGVMYTYPEGYQGQVAPGNARLFEFSGIRNYANNGYRKYQEYSEHSKPAIVKNINTTGNTGDQIVAGDDLAMKIKVSGLYFTKFSYTGGQVENSIIRQYVGGVFGNHGLGQASEDDRVQPAVAIEHKNHLFVKDSKIFDCSNCAIMNYCDGGIDVTNCVMKRFGSACVLNAGDYSNVTSGAITTLDKNCVCENKVTGQEIYFSAVGAGDKIETLKSIDTAFVNDGFKDLFGDSFSTKSILFREKDGNGNDVEYFDLIALHMDCSDYVASTNGEFYSTVNLGMKNDQTFVSSLQDITLPANPLDAVAKTDSGVSWSSATTYPGMPQAGAYYPLTGDNMSLVVSLGQTYLGLLCKLCTVSAK